MRIALSICALLALAATVGCGAGKTTTTSTTVTTSDDDKSTTVTSAGGSTTVGVNAVDASKLGAPVYPGATQAEGAGAVSFTTAAETNNTANFMSSDAFETVYDYYKGQLPAGSEKMKISSGDSQLARFQIGDENSKDVVSVLLASKDGKTEITISHVTKTDAAMASAAPSSAP